MSEAPSNQISIRVRSTRGEEVLFKLRPHTTMDKVIKAFCDKIGADASTLRLTFDGNRIKPTETCASLGLEEGDILDVMEFQVGGTRFF